MLSIVGGIGAVFALLEGEQTDALLFVQCTLLLYWWADWKESL